MWIFTSFQRQLIVLICTRKLRVIQYLPHKKSLLNYLTAKSVYLNYLSCQIKDWQLNPFGCSEIAKNLFYFNMTLVLNIYNYVRAVFIL